MTHFVEQCQERQAQLMLLEVRESNARAIELYKTSGFDVVGIRKGYYRGIVGRENAVVMSRK